VSPVPPGVESVVALGVLGGAHISDLIEAASGMNLWSEWAKLEIAAATGQHYVLPNVKKHFAGLLVSPAREEAPGHLIVLRPGGGLAHETRASHRPDCGIRGPQPRRATAGAIHGAVRREFHTSAPARETAGH
jgi:hypothetical protein